jgi:uncharacterized protein with von Willebrand factor type A (vWA) domain
MNNSFERFTHFGSIADKDIRKKLAIEIYEQITKETEKGIGFTNSNTDNFADAVKIILANETMKELCIQDKELAEKITQDILDFINKTKKQINKTTNPYYEETELKESFCLIDRTSFENQREWLKLKFFLEKEYSNREIDLSFYSNEFWNSLDPRNEVDSSITFESVKEHFIEKWEELLFKKKTKWELEIIEEQRKKFCEELYKQIEELKKLQEALEPFTNELGRLWDMSKGNWQRANLDILKRYAELLKKDKSLKDLAEMLGKMRQAEKEFEEEIFSNTSIKPEWKAEHASKADLIGIRESDDLSSLLPSETALLSDETMQSVFFKKFAEKKLQTFEYQAKVLSFKEEEFQDKQEKEKEETQGPFIICVDTSGSMHGTPETVAKTLCFAILKIAIRDNRKCYLISFSTDIETLNLTDLKNSIDKIINFLSMSFYGGTDATPAMREALRMLTKADYKKADVIMLSDFVMSAFDKATQEKILKAKENKTKFHSLVVGNSQNPATIANFDNNWFYDTNNPNSILTLVKNISDL